MPAATRWRGWGGGAAGRRRGKGGGKWVRRCGVGAARLEYDEAVVGGDHLGLELEVDERAAPRALPPLAQVEHTRVLARVQRLRARGGGAGGGVGQHHVRLVVVRVRVRVRVRVSVRVSVRVG